MVFCVTKFGGLIHGGAYFRNFTVLLVGCFDVVVWIFLVLPHSRIVPSTTLEGFFFTDVANTGNRKGVQGMRKLKM